MVQAVSPTVLRSGPYRCFFFSNEGAEPPHIHVESGGGHVKVWLLPVSLSRHSGFSLHERGEILRLVHLHRVEFLSAWHDYFRT